MWRDKLPVHYQKMFAWGKTCGCAPLNGKKPCNKDEAGL
jgi:hypothetical protein